MLTNCEERGERGRQRFRSPQATSGHVSKKRPRKTKLGQVGKPLYGLEVPQWAPQPLIIIIILILVDEG